MTDIACHHFTTIRLEELAEPAVAEHYNQFSDVTAKIIQRVLADHGVYGEVRIPTVEDMHAEYGFYQEEPPADLVTRMMIEVVQTFNSDDEEVV